MPLTGDERKAWIREEDRRRWRKVFRILYTIAAVTFSLGVFSVYTGTQDAKQNDIDARRTVQLEQIVRDIQQSRIDINREQCEGQNARHDGVLRQLDDLIEKIEKSGDPEQVARAKASRPGTILLIEQLAPKQDCDALIRKRFP